jgi:anaerobic magnesium-protoporphyrin IX monomethyl ester cyclase
MKVLLTNSPLRFYHIVTFLHPDWLALNLAMLAGAVEDFCDVKIVDNWHPKYKSDEDIWKALFDFKPHVLAVSNSTLADTDCICELVKSVRAVLPSLVIVSRGYGAMVRKSDLLNAGVDFIIDGEGELTFRELMKALIDKRGLGQIAGISYMDGNEEVSTPCRPFVDDIDSLPFPARQYLPRLKALFTQGYSSALEISRGCCFDCNFCSVASFWKKSFRVKSVSRVLTEIDQILSLGCDQIYLVDDSFGLDVKRTYEVLQSFVDNNLKFKWVTQIRSDTVARNPDLIRLAAETGLIMMRT